MPTYFFANNTLFFRIRILMTYTINKGGSMSNIQKAKVYEFRDCTKSIWRNIAISYDDLVKLLGRETVDRFGMVMWFFHIINPDVEKISHCDDTTLCLIWRSKSIDMKKFHIRVGNEYCLKYLNDLGFKISNHDVI